VATRQPKQPKKPLTPTQFKKEFAVACGLSADQVEKVVAGLTKIMKQQLGKRGAGTLTLFGLIKLRTRRRRAIPARQGIHPITKQVLMFPARAAKTLVRARALKQLLDLVN
jgi:nucleoid DNA-binding protein